MPGLCLALAAPTLAIAHSETEAERSAVPAAVVHASWRDFNDDGRADLAIGVPFDDVGTTDEAGVVHVLYGASGGLTSAGRQVWHQNRPNVADQAEEDDHFGWALAPGDYNGDGFADLAIGVPDEDFDGNVDRGGFNLLYGSANGLVASADQPFRAIVFCNGCRQGAALAALDVVDVESTSEPGTDGLADLAVGVPDSTGGRVLFTSGSALDADLAAQRTYLVETGLAGAQQVGFSLAAADLDLDPVDDLAVGAPGADVLVGSTTQVDAGALVTIHNGSDEQVTVWTQGDLLTNSAETGDGLGWAVAAGDIDGDGFDDIAAGAPFENLGGQSDAGLVALLLSQAGITHLHRDSTGVPGSIAGFERFGQSLEVANFGKGARKDLAVGIPGATVDSAPRAGAVVVMYAAGTIFATSGNRAWHQAVQGIADTPALNDDFGASLYAANFNASGPNDLAIGVPHDTVGDVDVAGVVQVLYSTADGLQAAGDQRWFQGTAIGETAQEDDNFGFALP